MAIDIHREAREGTLTATKLSQFLQDGGQIDSADVTGTGFTPLAAAAKAGHTSVVKLLLENRASPDQKSKYGLTPLYVAANARAHRFDIVKLLLDNHANIDATDPLCDNETPLMVAITQARDPKVVALLRESGASLDLKNSKGETAKSLADSSGIPAIQSAITPPNPQRPGLTELINTLVNFVLFILAYVNSGMIKGVVKGVISNLYHIVIGADPDPIRSEASCPIIGPIPIRPIEYLEDIDNPTTVDDFKKGIDQFVEDNNLGKFFAPGNDFLQKVAEKAVELKNDPKNHLKNPEQIKGLVQLAMYQPIFYCDDSGSMKAEIHDSSQAKTRMDAQRELVKRMASIATRLVPDGHGAHLRFINKDPSGDDDLNQDQIDEKMKFEPGGGTKIWTQLQQRILKPFVYDILESGNSLQRPYLVLTITDGEPTYEDKDTFKKAIVDCGRKLTDPNHNYEQDSVMFLVSQVGDDEAADAFLTGLGGDSAIDRVLFRTTERLDSKFTEIRDNEAGLEEWLFGILMKPITG